MAFDLCSASVYAKGKGRREGERERVLHSKLRARKSGGLYVLILPLASKKRCCIEQQQSFLEFTSLLITSDTMNFAADALD
jgi:hypothetical protein